MQNAQDVTKAVIYTGAAVNGVVENVGLNGKLFQALITCAAFPFHDLNHSQ